jgi:ParB-like chromosome segregation protein Spo0J
MSQRYSIEWVDVHDIHEDRDNPNTMNEQEFDALVSEIKLHGLIQPIVTRKCSCEIINKEHRVIVGGEHRWRATQHPEIAMKEVPCIDVDLREEDAKLLMVNLNRIHGNFIPLKLAGLMVDLSSKIPADELQKRLYVSKQDLIQIMYPKAADSIKVSTASPIAKGLDKPLKDTQLFSIALARQQYDSVIKALDKIMQDKKCKRAEALCLACESYLMRSKTNTDGEGR